MENRKEYIGKGECHRERQVHIKDWRSAIEASIKINKHKIIKATITTINSEGVKYESVKYDIKTHKI